MIEWYGPDHDAYRMLFAGAYSSGHNHCAPVGRAASRISA
jgi:hypothetical protein